jgi:hypothetical protein
MRTLRSCFGFLCIVGFASSAHLQAGVIPPTGLAPGSQYQLVFMTSGKRDATSANIADYNAFVTAQAALSSELPSGATWHAIASTDTVAANVNAPDIPGIPVYNTGGELVRIASQSIYGSGLNEAIHFDQFGASADGTAWTGSDVQGNPDSIFTFSLALGNTDLLGAATTGASSTVGGFWIDQGEDASTALSELLTLYALSEPITFVPEPSTLTLFGSAFLLLIAFVQRSRRSMIRASK